MKLKNYFLLLVMAIVALTVSAQENNIVPNVEQGPTYTGAFDSMIYVPSLASRRNELTKPDDTPREAQDKRSLTPQVVIGKDPQTWDDYYASNPHPESQSVRVMPPLLVFDAFESNYSPSDPTMAVGPNHVFVTYNTAFVIYDKNGNILQGPTSPNPAIFPGGGCCDLTVTYDTAADRWVLTFLGATQSIAVSDGPDPINDGWYVYSQSFNDYQKLSVWSDGYYMTQNSQGSNKIFALERDAMLAGSPAAQIAAFNLPGIAGTTPFFSAQFLNVSDGNMPAPGGATVMFLQDDHWTGINYDHIKYWTVDMDWVVIGNSTVSTFSEIVTAPFHSVFDGGSFSNLSQPGGGADIDAVQNTIMNMAQFRKFGGHNSAIFNFTVDTDGGGGELAGVRWYEFRQTADNQPWTLYQEGTYTAPDGRHAWMASMIMDGNGNIGLGYSSMAGPTTPNPTDFRVGSYYTGRFDGDALGAMTVVEEVIGVSNQNVPNLRYCDYNKMTIDPNNDSTFWFINEYMNSGRKGIVGVFELAPNTTVDDIGATSIVAPVSGPLTANENITINIRNFGINDIVNPEVQYDVDGGAPIVENYAGTLAAGATDAYTFATQADLSVPGDYTITASTNLVGDSNPGNDEVSKIVTNGILYCQPTMDCSVGDGFQLVSVNEINNVSGCEGYGDFTDQIASMDADMTYQVTFTTGYGNQNVKGWIDFNDDGVFDNTEVVVPNFVIAPSSGSGSYTETVDLVVPAGIPSGQHRMRFKSNWQAPVPANACEETTWGETEDYTADVDGVLGIEDLTIANGELIVLSKANDHYEISLVTDFDGIASIAIYNVLGQTLAFNNLEKEGNAYNYQLDMSYAAPGVYFIKIGDRASNSFKSAKIIVK